MHKNRIIIYAINRNSQTVLTFKHNNIIVYINDSSWFVKYLVNKEDDMRKVKKLVSALLIGAMVSAPLIGCGGGATKSADTVTL